MEFTVGALGSRGVWGLGFRTQWVEEVLVGGSGLLKTASYMD